MASLNFILKAKWVTVLPYLFLRWGWRLRWVNLQCVYYDRQAHAQLEWDIKILYNVDIYRNNSTKVFYVPVWKIKSAQRKSDIKKGSHLLFYTQCDLKNQKKQVVNFTRGSTKKTYSDDWLKCHQSVTKACQIGPLNSVYCVFAKFWADWSFCFVFLWLCMCAMVDMCVCVCQGWSSFFLFGWERFHLVQKEKGFKQLKWPWTL